MGARILVPFAIIPVTTFVAEIQAADPGLLAWIERMGGWAVTAILVYIIVTKQQETIRALVTELQSIKLTLNTLTDKCCGGRLLRSQEGHHE
jgi:hypothetical protein